MNFFVKLFYVIFVFLLISNKTMAQDEMRLAMTYFNQKEYDKAAPIFYKLYKKRHVIYYFNYYLKCLIAEKEYTKAEKVIKREQKRHPQQKTFIVDLANLYELMDKKTQAQRLYKSLFIDIPHQRSDIVQIANTMLSYRKYELAAEFYTKAQKITGQYFFSELLSIYTLLRDNEKIIKVILDWLDKKPQNLSIVQARIRPIIEREINNEFSSLLEKKLLEAIKKRGNLVYYRFLIWLYMEKRNLSKALEVAINFDKRLKGFGREVFNIGQLAYDFDSLLVAEKAFKYLVDKRKDNPFSPSPQFNLLRVYYKRIKKGQIQDKQEIENIENKYISVIKESKITQETVELIRQLVDIETIYLHNPDKSLTYIEQALSSTDLNSHVKALLLFQKAKVFLAQNRPWDALLLLNKIAYDYADTKIELEAKLLAGKIFMYLGQIDVAKIYLDKIKGYVGSEVSNDAIINAFFIARAMGDSILLNTIQVFAKAEYFNLINNIDSASYFYDSVAVQPNFLSARSLLEKGKMYLRNWQYDRALNTFEKLIKNYSLSLYTDQALYLAAKIYERKGNKEKAREYYKQIIFNFKDSPLVWQARQRFLNLNN